MQIKSNDVKEALDQLKAELIREECEKAIPEQRDEIKTIEDALDEPLIGFFRKAERLCTEKDKDSLRQFREELLIIAELYQNEDYLYEARVVSDLAHIL